MTGDRHGVPATDLRPGRALAHDLVDSQGRVLLRAFEPMTEPAIALAEAAGARLSLGQIGEEALEPQTRMVVLVDAQPQELLGRRAEARRWRMDRELALVRSSIRHTAEAAIQRRLARWSRLSYRIATDPLRAGVVEARERIVAPVGEAGGPNIHEWLGERTALLGQVYARLASGATVSTGALDALIDSCIDEMADAPSRAGVLALAGGRREDALVSHALSVGILSMGVAIAMGFARGDVRAAGLAGLLCDVGLTVLPTNVRALDRPLTEEETNAMRRHVIYGAAMLERLRGSSAESAVPESVQIAVYQHHERLDGTGYPHRDRGEKIHDLARLVGGCDVLLALCEDRAHRPGLSPHAALTTVVRMANAGSLDKRVVRGLVSVAGLFPVGTRLRLDSGQVGISLGHTDATRPDRPIIRVPGRGVLDLSLMGERGPGVRVAA